MSEFDCKLNDLRKKLNLKMKLVTGLIRLFLILIDAILFFLFLLFFF